MQSPGPDHDIWYSLWAQTMIDEPSREGREKFVRGLSVHEALQISRAAQPQKRLAELGSSLSGLDLRVRYVPILTDAFDAFDRGIRNQIPIRAA